MDRLGSQCPLPGYLRPCVLICLLILTASLLSYPVLRTLSLQLHSAVTGSHLSGTYSVVFVNCPNEQIARDIARYGEEARVLPREAPRWPFRVPLLLPTTLCVHYTPICLG
uniref:Uncharacterized protein n=1 Tax=Suricata suricatta TaxID=37032 RepID=A0A673U6M6_SURSU